MKTEVYTSRNSGNVLPFVGGCGIAAFVAILVTVPTWMLKLCSTTRVSKDLIGDGLPGCIEFWTYRYQTGWTGLLSATIAIVAAILVVRSLRRMDQQNSVALAALNVAQRQLDQSHAERLGIAAEDGHKLAAALISCARHLGQMHPLAFDVLTSEFRKEAVGFEPLVAGFRRSGGHLLQSPRERELFEEFGQLLDCATLYFVTLSNPMTAGNLTTVMQSRRFKALNTSEAVIACSHAADRVLELIDLFRKRMLQLSVQTIP